MNTWDIGLYIVDRESNKILIKKTGEIVECSEEVANFLCKNYWNEQYNNRKHKDVISIETPIHHQDDNLVTIGDLLVSKEDTERDVVRNQIMSEIEEMIETLPEKLQVVYRAYFVDGEKCIDIAKLMSCTNDTVTHRKNKLAEKLHKFAEKQGYEIEDFERD